MKDTAATDDLEILCLILARGGSKRVPGKNIRPLNGKPLIAYTIECAKASKWINRILVSTDAPAIAEIAEKEGAETPFLRPDSISGDDATELDAFRHALGWLGEHEGYKPDFIVKLFPTSPFRKTASVDGAIRLLMEHPEADSVRSVTFCTEHPYKMWQIEDGWLQSLIPMDQKPDQAHTLSYQVLPAVYIQNASIDVTRPQNIWEKASITGTRILPYVMEADESIDINTRIDFKLAEILMKEDRD